MAPAPIPTSSTSSAPSSSVDEASIHTAALTGIIIFAVIGFLIVACIVGYCIWRRHERKKIPAQYKRPSYNPFRSSSYSSANIPLTSDTSYAGSTTNSPRSEMGETPSDSRRPMFSRISTASTVYTFVPDNEEDEEAQTLHRPRRVSTLVPVQVATNEGSEPSSVDTKRHTLSPEDIRGPSISISRASDEVERPDGRPRSTTSTSSFGSSGSPVISPLESVQTGRERSRSSVSLSRFYDSDAISRTSSR